MLHGEKLYAGCRGLTAENFALVGKIRKFLCKVYNLLIFSLGCIKTGWGCPQIRYRLLAHLSQMKDLLFVCRYVEPFRSYEFQIDGHLAKFVKILGFFPRQIFWGSKIKISKHRSSAHPPCEFCVKISWRSTEGRKFTAWVPMKIKKVQLQNISQYTSGGRLIS